MTGPEHYREAERLLARLADEDVMQDAKDTGISADAFAVVLSHTVAEAQVHATLALAAATAASQVDAWLGDDSREARHWTQAVSS